jgi:hypothetical protein
MLKKRFLCCRAEISTNNNNNTNDKEENGGLSNSSAGRRVHRDSRVGSITDGLSRGSRVRGRGRGRGRSNSGGTDVAGNIVKSLSSTRISSDTRFPPDCIQPQPHDGHNDTAPPSTHQYHRQNSDPPPANLQGTNRPQDEAAREHSRHSNSKYNVQV